MAIPKYQGFIPGIISNAEYGKSFSSIARKSLSSTKLEHVNKYFSSTGFNFDQKAHIDDTKHAQSHKYGKQQIQDFHPSQKVKTVLFSHSQLSASQRTTLDSQTPWWLQPTEPLKGICKLPNTTPKRVDSLKTANNSTEKDGSH